MINKDTKGLILYEGPSALDGEPILMIASGLAHNRTQNKKTPGMVQTSILRADMSVSEAYQTGADESICGHCPMRRGLTEDGDKTGGCYVNLMAPGGVKKAFDRGAYDYGTPEDLSGEKIRLGMYGDPAAVPDISKRLAAVASNHTGYTHQMGYTAGKLLKGIVQASCETIEDARKLWKQGWKTFRVKLPWEPLEKGEILCPFEATAGRVTCATCELCTGSKANVAINVHGPINKTVMYGRRRGLTEKLMDKLRTYWNALPHGDKA